MPGESLYTLSEIWKIFEKVSWQFENSDLTSYELLWLFSHVVPFHPEAHEHIKSPDASEKQVPPFKHRLPEHALESSICKKLFKKFLWKNLIKKLLLSHWQLSPVNLSLHMQAYPAFKKFDDWHVPPFKQRFFEQWSITSSNKIIKHK